MREDPWEFEHFQARAGRHERAWLADWLDRHPDSRPPTKMILCPQCGGRGGSSLYLGTFSHDELWEDPEFAEDYLNGGYDRTCESCDGRNVVEIFDDERMPADMRGDFLEWMADEYQSDAIARQEWMMGA